MAISSTLSNYYAAYRRHSKIHKILKYYGKGWTLRPWNEFCSFKKMPLASQVEKEIGCFSLPEFFIINFLIGFSCRHQHSTILIKVRIFYCYFVISYLILVLVFYKNHELLSFRFPLDHSSLFMFSFHIWLLSLIVFLCT